MIRSAITLLLTWIAAGMVQAAGTVSYDPLAVPKAAVSSMTFEVRDEARGRTLPIRVYLPANAEPVPVILFSHGLGGSRDNNPYLGDHWAKRGYVVVFVQHPGSDESVWKNTPVSRRMDAMKQAASIGNFLARAMDVPAVIDALTTWNREPDHPLHGRLDLEHLGMSGHSFGANTTQAVAGQGFPPGRSAFLEPRIDAALMMSPSPPAAGDPAKAFAPVSLPCLLMTGTLDDSPIGNHRAADRMKVFPFLEKAPAWQVVFDQATHMSFGERAMSDRKPGNSRYHRAILALSTAFWDAELKGCAPAKDWLNGDGAKSVLTPADAWQMNAKARAMRSPPSQKSRR